MNSSHASQATELLPNWQDILINCLSTPVKLFRRGMHNYATLCDKFIQHYATLCIIRGDISPRFRRLIVVNDRFCGDISPQIIDNVA